MPLLLLCLACHAFTKWEIDLQRLKSLFESFDTIQEISIYYGTFVGSSSSEKRTQKFEALGYRVLTKPVKIMQLPIDVSSITKDSPDILKNFIAPELLKKFKVETVEYLNARLAELNQLGITHLEKHKCNFDVEIGRDMLQHEDSAEGFCLWSGDSDFADPLLHLLKKKKKVSVFATSRRVSAEMNELRQKGLFIYDIVKIREFIEQKKTG